MLRYLLVVIGLLLITACGQTGPLYLPNGKQPTQQTNNTWGV